MIVQPQILRTKDYELTSLGRDWVKGCGTSHVIGSPITLHPVSTKRGQFIVLGPKCLWLNVQCFYLMLSVSPFPLCIFISSFLNISVPVSLQHAFKYPLYFSLSSDRCVVVFITLFIMRDSINVDYLTF